MTRLPPRSTPTDTLLPYSTLFRSVVGDQQRVVEAVLLEERVLVLGELGLGPEREERPAAELERHERDDAGLLPALNEQVHCQQSERSEERRVGKEGGKTCRSRWAPSH